MRTRTGVGRCCCGGTTVCGCSTTADYVDDFSGGTLESGWTLLASNDVEPAGGLLVFTGSSTEVGALERCIVLPDMLTKMVVLEFTCVSIGFLDTIAPLLLFLNDECLPLHDVGLRINPNLTATAYKEPNTAAISTDPVEGSVFRLEVELIDDTPYTYEARWYIDAVLVDSETEAADEDAPASVCLLQWDWTDAGTTNDITLDDMTFGVYDA